MARGGPLGDVHRSMAIYLDDDDREVAALHDRLELVAVTPPDAAPMKFDRVPERLGAPRNLGFVPFETSDDGHLHDVYYNRRIDTFKAYR